MLILFFHIAAMYLFLHAEFISAIQIIVYAGAIMVLFLFVIMLLNQRQELLKRRLDRLWPVAAVVSAVLLIVAGVTVVLIKAGHTGNWGIGHIDKVTHTVAIAQVLFFKYLLPFELASLILLVAIIGAIVLAKKRLL
jgi:NADH-quinone oxidoreductase subunit J